jgi:xanthine dehydrogenase YagR molybdenum-binding subunit
MQFDHPAGSNPIDQGKVVGQALPRIDGALKTTGTATYAYEQNAAVADPAYGYIVGAPIAKGRITALDASAARAAPGVLAVVTAQNAGPLGVGEFYVARALAGPAIDHYHQAVAIVVAATFEQARAAAGLVRITCVATDGAYDLAAVRDQGVAPKTAPDIRRGDFDTAFAAAPVQVDATYTTPDQSHVMMEPHATLARWQGDQLTLWTSVQIIKWGRRDLAKIFNLPADKIRLVSPYIGGGFGGKASALSDAVLAALAARAVKRPVKVALPRPLMFNNTTHRPATVQRVRLGAAADGTLAAIGHDSWSGNLPGGMAERATLPTASLYAGAHRLLRTRLALLDLPEGNAMRAPGEAPGMMAFEVAMDELAEQLGLDPVELRIRNDTQHDPAKPERKFSTRPFIACLRTGAERFGWQRRQPKPASVRDGDWLIGMGVAAAIRGDNAKPSGARVKLAPGGMVTVETDMTDIGTGSYTILGQTAAEMLGVPLDRVVVKLGDSRFPEACGSLGQSGANSATSGVYAACVKLREAIARRHGFNPATTDFVDGEVRSGARRLTLAQAALAGELAGEDTIEFGPARENVAHQTFGAHFCEVAVNAYTGEVRVRRMLAVCAAGRILNPLTARSQVIGAMTMGLGAALMEELVIDHRAGFFVNHDMAGYEVPVHADVPHQEVMFIDEVDPSTSPMKSKGVGELGISGVAAAVANAVYNATGVRVRDYPVTLDKLIGKMPIPA